MSRQLFAGVSSSLACCVSCLDYYFASFVISSPFSCTRFVVSVFNSARPSDRSDARPNASDRDVAIELQAKAPSEVEKSL